MQHTTTLAIFDLDHTLLWGDSDYLWGQFLVKQGLVDGSDYEKQNSYFYQQYRAGTLDIEAFQAFSQKPLTEHPLEQLYHWREQFINEAIKPIITEKAYQLVQHHRTHGHRPLIVTATNRFITEPIAKLFDIPDLLATELAMDANGYTGQIDGTACFREGKVKRVHQWLKTHDYSLQGSYGYTDSINDLPLLDMVDYPHAVNPDKPLRTLATQRGWPIISLSP